MSRYGVLMERVAANGGMSMHLLDCLWDYLYAT